MEDSLTLQELVETYVGIMEQETRQLKGFARIMGADVKDDGESEFGRVARQIKEENEMPDIVSQPIRAKGGERFGVGFGLGHTEVQ